MLVIHSHTPFQFISSSWIWICLFPLSIIYLCYQTTSPRSMKGDQPTMILHVYTGQQNSYHCSALLWLCYNLWFCIFPILKFKEPSVLSIWRSLFDKINNWWILWKNNLERIVVQGVVLPSMLWVGGNHGDVWKLVLWFFWELLAKGFTYSIPLRH